MTPPRPEMNEPVLSIERNLDAAADRPHDLIVIGGGVYGICLALEAVQRGLRPLLLERGDFGGQTSWNSLRIIHGGLRYLQSLDLKRFRDSVRERRWFLQNFPDLIKPLPCIMPVDNRGLRRPAILGAALRLNDWLSRDRNHGVAPANHLPDGHLLSREQLAERCPALKPRQLAGGGLWYDAMMASSPRVMMELLRWACAGGAVALNYVEASRLLIEQGRVAGVHAADRVSRGERTFRASSVINAAGPWCREVATTFDRDYPSLYTASLAFNLRLDHPPPTDAALAVWPRAAEGGACFLVPWHGQLLLGTRHLAWSEAKGEPVPPQAAIDELLEDVNHALPGMNLQRHHVRRCFAGFLPAKAAGETRMASRPVWIDHARHAGPRGLISVSGVKFTTARRVAEQTLTRLHPDRPRTASVPRPEPASVPDVADWHAPPSLDDAQLMRLFTWFQEHEAVVYPHDLLLRRTDWGVDPSTSDALEQRLCTVGTAGPGPSDAALPHDASAGGDR